MKRKKPAKRKKSPKVIVVQSDKSFEELIEDAFNDKVLKKGPIVRSSDAKPQKDPPPRRK